MYKVGDKVIIKRNLQIIPNFRGGYVSDMRKMEGEIYTIKEVIGPCETSYGSFPRGYRFYENDDYIWDERALEPFVLTTISANNISCSCFDSSCLDDFTDGNRLTTSSYITKKEEEEKEKMNCEKILKIYIEKKDKKLKERIDKKEEECARKDKLAIIRNEAIKQMNEILKKEEQCEIPQKINYCILTKKTKEKLDEMKSQYNKEREEFSEKIDEVRALLEVAPDYKTAMEILENYGIIDKKTGKILDE